MTETRWRYFLTKLGGELWLSDLDRITDYGQKADVLEARGEKLCWFGFLWLGWKFWYTIRWRE